MPKDRGKNSNNSPPTKDGVDNIPLLESIVIPGHSSDAKQLPPPEKRSPKKKIPAADTLSADTWSSTSAILDTLKDAIKLEAHGIVSSIIEQETKNILDNIEHFLVND